MRSDLITFGFTKPEYMDLRNPYFVCYRKSNGAANVATPDVQTIIQIRTIAVTSRKIKSF